MHPANPIKFCLKYDPPIIAIVYQFLAKTKKYVHEIRIDMKDSTDIGKLCDELCARESAYLNPQKISKQQVQELLNKMKDHLFKKEIKDKENKFKE